MLLKVRIALLLALLGLVGPSYVDLIHVYRYVLVNVLCDTKWISEDHTQPQSLDRIHRA